MFGAYRFAAAFPGAIFIIPCDRDSTCDTAEGGPITPRVNEARFAPFSAGSTPSTCNGSISRADCFHCVAESEYGFDPPLCTAPDDGSTEVVNSDYDSDSPSDTASESSSPDSSTWGRRPENSDLGPLIDIISPWDMEDARKVFGRRLRYGNSIRPKTPVPNIRNTATLSHPPSSTTERGCSMREPV